MKEKAFWFLWLSNLQRCRVCRIYCLLRPSWYIGHLPTYMQKLPIPLKEAWRSEAEIQVLYTRILSVLCCLNGFWRPLMGIIMSTALMFQRAGPCMWISWRDWWVELGENISFVMLLPFRIFETKWLQIGSAKLLSIFLNLRGDILGYVEAQSLKHKGKIILPKSIRLGPGNFDSFPIQNFLTLCRI